MYKMRPHCRGNSLNNYSKSPDNQDQDNQGTVLSLHDDKKN